MYRVIKNPEKSLDFSYLKKYSFKIAPIEYCPVTAAFAAQVSLLAYETNTVMVSKILGDVGFRTEFFDNRGAQALIAYQDSGLVFIGFRGTTNEFSDILSDVRFWPDYDAIIDRRVHKGFSKALSRIDRDIYRFINDLRRVEHIVYCGHSLGGALACLAAARHEELFCTTAFPDCTQPAVYSYASPRVGGRSWVAYMDYMKHYRHSRDSDLVTMLPLPIWYRHCGTLCWITDNGKVTIGDMSPVAAAKDHVKTLVKTFFERPSGLVDLIMNSIKEHNLEREYVPHILANIAASLGD